MEGHPPAPQLQPPTTMTAMTFRHGHHWYSDNFVAAHLCFQSKKSMTHKTGPFALLPTEVAALILRIAFPRRSAHQLERLDRYIRMRMRPEQGTSLIRGTTPHWACRKNCWHNTHCDAHPTLHFQWEVRRTSWSQKDEKSENKLSRILTGVTVRFG